jgi:post-segregation antitoxin (ccd killing protein)
MEWSVPCAYFDYAIVGMLRMPRTTNVTLPEGLLREARDLDINLSAACERGLPLAAYRQF